MTDQPTIAEVRQTQGAQIERLEKLKRDKRLATPAEQERIQKDIDIVAQDIRNLDTVIQGIIEQKTSKR
jgi:hypothetical protein